MYVQGLPGLVVLLLITLLLAGHPALPAGLPTSWSGLSSPSCLLTRTESELRCRAPGGKLCSDRGRCECGVCICQVTESGKYYGPLCECRDWVCEIYDGKICAGEWPKCLIAVIFLFPAFFGLFICGGFVYLYFGICYFMSLQVSPVKYTKKNN